MKKKSGRTAGRIPNNQKADPIELHRIIALFKQQYGELEKITGERVHKYALQLEKQKIISKAFGENFWTKKQYLGYQIIEEHKNMYSFIVKETQKQKYKIPDVAAIVNKRDPNNELIQELLPLQNFALKMIAKEKNFEEQILTLQAQLDSKYQTIIHLREKVANLEQALFELMWYSTDRRSSLENTMSLTQNKKILEAVSQVFSNPKSFYSWYSEKVALELEQITDASQNKNVVSFEKAAKQKILSSLANDYDDL
ncbi:hypothetical protein [Brevibacillus fortis]|uniref:Uncharacterized protein n=1 Tax=Brevibacillus fortis TaxID=2126352 RepID=A0A2P7VH81_9BACL|nr:hypothetical protein [Brevibacillus fortis]PSJ98539.1 hypothetical protein C7R93_06240 [Brevibacillus fortis]